MEKRTLLALAISFLVLGFYPVLLQKFYPEVGARHAVPLPQTEPALAPAAPSVSTSAEALEKFSTDEDKTFANRKLQLVLNPKGGAIRGIAFPEFVDSETSKPLELMSLADPLRAPTSVTIFDAPSQTLSAYRTEILADKVMSAAPS